MTIGNGVAEATTNPPTAVTATASSSTQIQVSWKKSTSSGILYYSIFRCDGAGCTGYQPRGVVSGTLSTYADSYYLSPATSYSYYVVAITSSGQSSNSNTTTTTTPAASDTQPPTAPTNLVVTVSSSTSASLSWTASTDNIGVADYIIEDCNYYNGSGCTSFSIIGTSASSSYSATGLNANTYYIWRVRARDAVHNSSGYSNLVTTYMAVDTQAPTTPTNLTATAPSSSQINLAWTASTDNVGVTGYRIERCTGSTCTTFTQIATSTTTSYSDTGLTASTTYSYRVRANDAAGNLSAYSSTANGTTSAAPDTTPPTAPINLTATATSGTQINLTWTASTDNVGVTNYVVEQCQGTGCSTFTQIGTTTATSYSNTGLTSATAYSYRVRATDAASNLSAYSSIASATTPDTAPPTAPSGLTATASSSTQVNLSWTASTDNVAVTNYLIERCQGIACSGFSQVATSAATTYSDTNLTAANDYGYRIRSTDAANNLSGYSNTATTATQYAGPITFNYSYDNLGRITQASGSDGSVITYTYDTNGNLTSINRQ